MRRRITPELPDLKDQPSEWFKHWDEVRCGVVISAKLGAGKETPKEVRRMTYVVTRVLHFAGRHFLFYVCDDYQGERERESSATCLVRVCVPHKNRSRLSTL